MSRQLGAKRSIVNKNVSSRVGVGLIENSTLKFLKIKLCNTIKRKTLDSSAVWKYFGELYSSDGKLVDEENYYCNPCLTTEKQKLEAGQGGHLSKVHRTRMSTSSTNLRNHLFLAHKISAEKASTSINTKSDDVLKKWCNFGSASSSATASSSSAAATSQYDLNRDIALWFATDLLPFSCLEKQGFAKFMEKNFGMIPPSCSMITQGSLIDMFKATRRAVIDHLKDATSTTLLFDGWTDKYRKISFKGLKCAIVDNNWERKLFTLACLPLESHTSESVADFIKEIVLEFFNKRTREIKIHTVHDGAANMGKTSRLLGSVDAQHCLAHVLHLILTTDGFSKCANIQDLLEKCRSIVTCINFKSSSLMNEAVKSDDAEVYKQLRTMAELKEVHDLEEQFPLLIEPNQPPGDVEREGLQLYDRKHKSLKMQICTRLNSALFMLESIEQLLDAVQNLLKQCGKRELCLDSDEKDLLHNLVLFLKPFETLTKVVSGSNTIAVLPLIKHKIEKLLLPCANDCTQIKQLKNCCKSKLECRLKMSDTATVACMLDPGVKVVFSKEELFDKLMASITGAGMVQSQASSSSLKLDGM